jgi:hypothetical protein
MQRILWAALVAVLGGLPMAAQGEQPRGGLLERGRDVVQACFHKHCQDRASCSPCGEDDVRIGQLIDTLFHAERACDRKNAALRLDSYCWTEHPEIVAALTYAMQSDCERCVRIAAADSLKDMRVADPDSIGAMQFTRAEDPSCRVRFKAKWGIIKGEQSRPPCSTYASGYGYPVDGREYEAPPPPQRLEPTPGPQMPVPERKLNDDTGTGPEAKRGIRSRVSSVMAKVRSRS